MRLKTPKKRRFSPRSWTSDQIRLPRFSKISDFSKTGIGNKSSLRGFSQPGGFSDSPNHPKANTGPIKSTPKSNTEFQLTIRTALKSCIPSWMSPARKTAPSTSSAVRRLSDSLNSNKGFAPIPEEDDILLSWFPSNEPKPRFTRFYGSTRSKGPCKDLKTVRSVPFVPGILS